MAIERLSNISEPGDRDYKGALIKYLNYLNENIKKCYDYSEYIKDMMSRSELEFDEENGLEIQKRLNQYGENIERLVDTSEKIAEELDRLYGHQVKRDTRINKILKDE